MILTQLLNPEELDLLSQKQTNILMSQLVLEIAASEEIKGILRKKAGTITRSLLKNKKR